jgi:hypothetical protein
MVEVAAERLDTQPCREHTVCIGEWERLLYTHTPATSQFVILVASSHERHAHFRTDLGRGADPNRTGPPLVRSHAVPILENRWKAGACQRIRLSASHPASRFAKRTVVRSRTKNEGRRARHRIETRMRFIREAARQRVRPQRASRRFCRAVFLQPPRNQAARRRRRPQSARSPLQSGPL